MFLCSRMILPVVYTLIHSLQPLDVDIFAVPHYE